MRPANHEGGEEAAGRCTPDAAGWRTCTGLALDEAERLLDWLEVCGVVERELSIGENGVTVRWRERV